MNTKLSGRIRKGILKIIRKHTVLSWGEIFREYTTTVGYIHPDTLTRHLTALKEKGTICITKSNSHDLGKIIILASTMPTKFVTT